MRLNYLCIFKTKGSRGTKLCSYFNFYFQLYRISGSEFYEWLFGPEKFSGLSRNEVLDRLSRLSLMSFFSYLHSFHFTLHMLFSRRRYALLGCFLNLVLLSFFLQIIVLISLVNGSKTGTKLWNWPHSWHPTGEQLLTMNNCNTAISKACLSPGKFYNAKRLLLIVWHSTNKPTSFRSLKS